MHLNLTKSRDNKLLQYLLDKKLRVIVVFEDDYLNHIARIAYKDIQQDNYTYRIGKYNIYKGEEWGFCDFCEIHDCYFIVPNETIESGSSEIPKDLEKAAEEYADKHGFRVPYDGSNNYYDDVDVKASKEGFKAGAEWMRKKDVEDMYMSDNRHFLKCYEQGKVDMRVEMMKDAVEGKIVKDITNKLAVTAKNINLDGLKFGDKVKIIIVKKKEEET